MINENDWHEMLSLCDALGGMYPQFLPIAEMPHCNGPANVFIRMRAAFLNALRAGNYFILPDYPYSCLQCRNCPHYGNQACLTMNLLFQKITLFSPDEVQQMYKKQQILAKLA